MSRRPPADLNIVAAFYSRWAPHEDKRREIADDHKAMFAEAKSEGLNPKALRKAFAEQYRVENQTADQAEKRNETDGDVELYLSALARVREDEPEHDADGVIIESTAARKDVRGLSTDETQGSSLPVVARNLEATDGSPVAPNQTAGTQAPPVDTIIEPVTDPTAVSLAAEVTEAGDDRSAGTPPSAATVVAFRTHNPTTHFLNSKGLPRLHGCLNAEACGGSPRALCFSCSVRHEGPAFQGGVA